MKNEENRHALTRLQEIIYREQVRLTAAAGRAVIAFFILHSSFCLPASAADAFDYRTVNGQLYNIRRSTNWFNKAASVARRDGGIYVLKSTSLTHPGWFAVTNLPTEKATLGRTLNFRAMRVGQWETDGGVPLELWDYGIPTAPPAPVVVPAAPVAAPVSSPVATLEKRRADLYAQIDKLTAAAAAEKKMHNLQGRTLGNNRAAHEAHYRAGQRAAEAISQQSSQLRHQIAVLELQIEQLKRVYERSAPGKK